LGKRTEKVKAGRLSRKKNDNISTNLIRLCEFLGDGMNGQERTKKSFGAKGEI